MPNAIANDTALIATCNAAADAHAAFHAAGGNLHIDDRAGRDAALLAGKHLDALLDQMEAMPAATLEGMRAKAGIVARVHQFHDHPNEGPLLSLLADLGATRPAD